MKKGTVLIVAGVGVLGAAGLAWYFHSRKQAGQQQMLPPGTQPTNLIDAATPIIQNVVSMLPTRPTVVAGQYEGKLIRVARSKVYLVKDNLLHYVSALPLADGRGWESVVDVASTDLKEGLPLSGVGHIGQLPFNQMCFN